MWACLLTIDGCCVAVRGVLGLYLVAAFVTFTRSVQLRFGGSVMTWLIIFSVSQFHFFFYMSRTLPNTFALAFGTSTFICVFMFCKVDNCIMLLSNFNEITCPVAM